MASLIPHVPRCNGRMKSHTLKIIEIFVNIPVAELAGLEKQPQNLQRRNQHTLAQFFHLVAQFGGALEFQILRSLQHFLFQSGDLFIMPRKLLRRHEQL